MKNTKTDTKINTQNIQKKQKEDKIDFVVNAYRKGWAELRDSWKKISIYFIKILVIGIAIFTFISLLLGIGIISLAVIDPLIIWAIIGILILLSLILLGIIESVKYNIIDNIINKKEIKIIENAKNNLVPWIKYNLFYFAFCLIGIIPVILLYLMVFGGLYGINGNGGNDAEASVFSFFTLLLGAVWISLIWIILFVIIMLIFRFIIQFVLFEMYIERKGLREAVKKSYEIVKNNLFETIGFNISFGLIMGVIISIVNLPIQIFARFAFVGISLMLQNNMFLIIGGSILLLVLIITILMNLFVEMTSLVFTYEFWRKARKRC
ncbi:MAG: glycerophosphoryl diester phosphodiesterase membrane domain-containing protein [Candidatus ainarchaeum sp.]|nr:glycerophosphoryl diester phosphodiesterase membrane domain-containing protein [Candidatus ainarchaeum sp.]